MPFEDGRALLTATWHHEQLMTLFGTEQKLMHTLTMAITRPVAV